MSYQWRRLQFFEKLIVTGDDQTKRPLKLFDPATTSLTSTASGHGFVFGGDNKGFIHRYSRATNTVHQFQAFDAICLHLFCLPDANTLLAIGYDHESIDPMFNPTLKIFKFNPATTTSNGPNQPSEGGSKQPLPTPSQELTSDFTCTRTIPLSPYLSNKTTTNEFGGERSGKLITVTCFTVTDDGNNVALGCDDGSLVTVELSKTRYIGNVWFRPLPPPTSTPAEQDPKGKVKPPSQQQQQQQQQQQDTSQWPKGPITTLHYRRAPKNTFLSLYLTTMTGVYVIHQTRQSLSAELLGMEGCHYHGSSLCYNSITNNISSLGELVLACPEITVFYSSEGDRLSCYFFPEHKKYIAFYNHFLIIVSDEGVPSNVDDSGFNTNPTSQNTPQTNPKAHFSSPQYNSPLSTLTQQVNPAGRNAIVIYDIHSKIIVFSLKCDVICGLQVIQGNQICFITQRGELMLLTELPLRNKMSVLLRRDLFNVALSLASSQCADKRLIIDITYKYGDYLYNKGDYEAATQHYMETIGYIEPAIIISKFLHSQRITCLTMYLEALHNKHLITCDHTTLLLTCYTKLRDLQKITSFLLQPHQLNKISAATPIETLKAIEYLKVYCNSLQIDFSHVDEMSSLTNVGEYLVRILCQASTIGPVATRTQPLTQKQMLENLSAVTTLYSTQHYHSLDVYNTIRVYMECNYYYHALFAAFLLGAHEYVLYLLINIGYHSVAIQYLSSLPLHLVVWLLHQYGLQLLREHPEEITLLCIKLICGWKRQHIFHNMVLTINHDISSTTSSECHATVDSIYKFDDFGLDEHYANFEAKQRHTKESLLLQEQQSLQTAQTVSKDSTASATGPQSTTLVTGGKSDKSNSTSSAAIAYHIYLRLAINDDGCVQINKCVGFDAKDLTGRCTTMDSQLAHLQLLDAKQRQQQQQQQLIQQQQQQQQEHDQTTTATNASAMSANGAPSGELSLDDFADDKPIKSTAFMDSDSPTTVVEQLYISPSDFIPLFSDSPQYLQAYLEAICAHATNLHQDKQKQLVLQNQRVNRRNRANQSDTSQTDPLLQSQDGVFDGTSGAKSSLLSKGDSVLFLNQHETITSALNAINSDYDYLQHLNEFGLDGMNKGQRNQQATLSFASSFDPNLDVSALLEFPTNNILSSTPSSAVLNASSSQGDALNIMGIQLQTTVAADNNIWTSLVELYAELIKSLQSNPSLQLQHQQQQQQQQHQQQQQQHQQQTPSDPKDDKSKPLLTLSSYKTPAELEQQVISIIKANMDHLDYASVLVVLESYDLESSLSYLYARTRQYHSLLNLQTNRKDWYKARQVCQAYGSQQQEPSLWLMLLVKIVECYPAPNDPSAPSTTSPTSSQHDLNPSASIPNSTNDLVNLLTLCVQQVHQLALLSPLQILSLLSTSPHIPIEPIRNFLLNVITVIQQESSTFSNDAQAFAVDTSKLQEQIHTLQYEPLVFKSIDCQRCKQQLTMPTIHFYCGHSFHQHCVIENDVSQQKPYQQQISSLYDIISTTMNPTIPLGQPGNDYSSNPYSSLLHNPSHLSEASHQQMMLTMFNQPLEFECPLCQPEHQRLQNIATSLFGANDYQSLEPGQSAKSKQNTNAVHQAQIHDKFIKRLDEASGQFSIIAEQLSRGMYLPQGYE